MRNPANTAGVSSASTMTQFVFSSSNSMTCGQTNRIVRASQYLTSNADCGHSPVPCMTDANACLRSKGVKDTKRSGVNMAFPIPNSRNSDAYSMPSRRDETSRDPERRIQAFLKWKIFRPRLRCCSRLRQFTNATQTNCEAGWKSSDEHSAFCLLCLSCCVQAIGFIELECSRCSETI